MSEPTYTLIGTPFSTFTRTIALALHYKDIPFSREAVLPHSVVAEKYHPLGYIPALVVRGVEGGVLTLIETQAIARYLDRVKPEPSLGINAGDGGAKVEESLWEFVNLVAGHAFKIIEIDVVKPYIASFADSMPSTISKEEKQARIASAPIPTAPSTTTSGRFATAFSTVSSALTGAAAPAGDVDSAVKPLAHYLMMLSSRMAPISPAGSESSRSGPFVFGTKVTWADYYLYPLLADVSSTAVWPRVKTARLDTFLAAMRLRHEVQETTEGTVEDGRTGP